MRIALAESDALCCFHAVEHNTKINRYIGLQRQ